MKIIVANDEGVTTAEIDPREMEKDGHYEFPCGCRFRIAEGDIKGQHKSIEYDLEGVSLDCPATWDLIGSGRTRGIFQLESPLGRGWAKKLKPENMEHLAALTAILRPGCLKSKNSDGISMTELYCQRKNGVSEVTYEIPALSPILGATYGILCFQEQSMQIARDLAGFDLREADQLRKSIGKKQADLMAKTKKLFLDKAKGHGVITDDEANTIFDGIEKSASYSFNASHAYAYATNTYWSAHWKAHFPLYFYTAYLYYAKEKADSLKEMRQLISDAKYFGIEVTPPRFSELREHFGLDTEGVRITFGLADVRGIGEKAVSKIREAAGDRVDSVGDFTWYEFLTGFADQCGAGVVRRMIEVGAMRDMPLHRQRMLAEFDAWDRLTDKEQEGVRTLSEPVHQWEIVKEEYQEEEPKYSPKAMKAYREAVANQTSPAPEHPPSIGTKLVKKSRTVVDDQGKPLKEISRDASGAPIVLDEAREASNLEDALRSILARPGALMKTRVPKVQSLLEMLEKPPFKLEDTPSWIAKVEEENLGLPISCSPVEAADRSIVNCSVKRYHEGWEPRGDALIVLGVEVQEVNEREVMNGDNRGRKMARLIVADETGVLEEVVCFPDSWDEYRCVLARAGSLVALGGKRSYKDRQSFFVDKVWEL
jgi:DNA polymerase III alpha subunit